MFPKETICAAWASQDSIHKNILQNVKAFIRVKCAIKQNGTNSRLFLLVDSEHRTTCSHLSPLDTWRESNVRASPQHCYATVSGVTPSQWNLTWASKHKALDGERAPSARYRPQKHKDPSSDPQHPEKAGHGESTCLEACWLSSLPRSSERPSLKK